MRCLLANRSPASGIPPYCSVWDAPIALQAADGNCGFLAAWAVLRHFRRRVSARRLLRDCGYVSGGGAYTVALACTFHEHGLRVRFYTDPDPAIDADEQQFYARVRRYNIVVQPAATVETLLSHIAVGCAVIVLYDTSNGVPHFSILIGATAAAVQFHDDPEISRQEFEHLWNAPGIFRQSIVIGAKPRKQQRLTLIKGVKWKVREGEFFRRGG